MDSDSEEDRKQRDEFAERLKKRDESQKRNIVARSSNFCYSVILYELNVTVS